MCFWLGAKTRIGSALLGALLHQFFGEQDQGEDLKIRQHKGRATIGLKTRLADRLAGLKSGTYKGEGTGLNHRYDGAQHVAPLQKGKGTSLDAALSALRAALDE